MVTMALLACVACPHPAIAQSRGNPSAADPPLPAASTPNAGDGPMLADPVTELPRTPSPQIDAFTLFPNQGEIKPSGRFDEQRFGYVLHGEAKAAYESNIFIQPHDAQEDFYFTISPGVAVGWGEFKSELYGPEKFRHQFEYFAGKNYFFIDYAPSYTWWVDHSDLDTFDHNVRLEAEWALQRLTLGASASYVTETVPVEDLGTRVERRRTLAALTSSYEFSGKTSFEVNAYYERYEYESNFVDSQEWRNEDWVNYQVSPKIKLGLGATFADVDRDNSAEQTYEQGKLRVIYEPSENLTISLVGGAEWRQTEGADDRIDGIFQLDAAWTPYDGTYIYLQGYRRSVTTSAAIGDYYIATGVYGRIRQRIFQRYYLSLTAGYQYAEYQNPANTPEFGRADDLFFIRPGVGFDLSTWLNCEISGEYRQNDSTIDRRGFDAAKATVRFNVLF